MSDSEENDKITEMTGKRTNSRVNSKSSEYTVQASSLTKLQVKRKHFMNVIKRLQKQIDDQTMMTAWSRGEVNQRIKKLDEASSQFEDISVQIVCEDDITGNSDIIENEQIDDLVMSLKAKLCDRLSEIDKADSLQPTQTKPYLIEVQQTDASGNIPNTWGTFDGDYSKWKSFRDRWMTLHENMKVKTIVKFQNLKTACIKAAEGALGEWDLTEENYQDAWDRLQSIYEDDYMQVQEFMRKLSDLPQMSSSSSQSIRDIIDTVHKHIHGVKRYINFDEGYAYVVFAVIERMDSSTYRAWEKHRPTLAKAKDQELDATIGDDQMNPNPIRTGKHIPTWQQLEEFLESEVTIRVKSQSEFMPKSVMAQTMIKATRQANARNETTSSTAQKIKTFQSF